MRPIQEILRERRAASRVKEYEADQLRGAHTSNGNYETLITHCNFPHAFKPLLREYEYSMCGKLARKNSYLTMALDDDRYVMSVWWVHAENGRYFGLSHYEFSHEALLKPKYKRGYHFDEN